METASLVTIAQEAISRERELLSRESHPHVLAAHRAALKDLDDTVAFLRRSTRLADKIAVSG